MKKFLKILILFVLLGILAYQYKSELVSFGGKALPIVSQVGNQIKNNIFKPTPCAEPIPYTLGTFDTKFNISKSYFLSALTDAEAIWEKPIGKELFTYAPASSNIGVLKINLIYDYRQEATSKLASLGIVVKDDKASYDALKSKFNGLQAQLTALKNGYDTQLQNFNLKLNAYNQEVQSWNAKGGAPQAEYDKLQTEKAALDGELSQLKSTETQINNMVSEINSMVVVLNRLVGTLNLSVEKYNTTNVSRGESFEEGVYQSDGVNKEIDIYEFSNRAKLVRVLAHELGHALGLDHSDDPKAIMYKLNQGNTETLTKTDQGALKAKCAIKS